MEELAQAIKDVKTGQKAERKTEKQNKEKAAPKMAAKKAKAKAKANSGKKSQKNDSEEESDTLDSEEPLSSQGLPAESEDDEAPLPCACHVPHFSSGNV